MYLNDLPAIEAWTSAQMGGKAGACIPETMRFNGNGYYNGGNNTQNASCATASSPSYNAENITSGAELALWIWQQYLDTGSQSFLSTYYPILEQVAIFELAYQKVGSDGFLHATANAHETQWAVTDPTTDLAADQALFPAVIKAATLLNTDSSLVSELKTAENEIEPYARANQSNLTQLLNSQPTSASAVASLDAAGTDVIADSYQPSATLQNDENIGLEPVWPYGDIGDSTVVNSDNLTALADRTYTSRPNIDRSDWSFDAVQAARLDLGSQVESDLVGETPGYQAYISGMANLGGSSVGDEPYIEQQSTVATALDEALATDYDGTLRFAPAWPSGWDASGTVYIQGGSKVDVQMEGGTLATAAIQAGSTTTMTVRNPWPGQQAEVVNGSTEAVVVGATTNGTLSVPVTAGSTYLVEQPSAPTTSLSFAQVTGVQASVAKHLGSQQIGLDAGSAYSTASVVSLQAHANGDYVDSAGSGTSLIADASSVGTNETFDLITNPDGTVSLRAHSDGDYVTAENAGVSPLIANRTAIGQWETFDLISNPDGSVSFRAHANGDIVTADNAGASPLIANRTAVGQWEEFTLVYDTVTVSFRAHANGDIVTAGNAGASPLIANRTAIGQWETFDLISNPDGSVSFRAHANGDIVTADNAGASPLIANRTAIGQWEEFDLIENADGSISLRAHANSDIVTADNAGASPLIANRTAIGQREEFDLIYD